MSQKGSGKCAFCAGKGVLIQTTVNGPKSTPCPKCNKGQAPKVTTK